MKIRCYCENELTLVIEDCYSLTPDIAEQIKSGDFLAISCEKCQKTLKPEVMFNIRDKNGKKYRFIPENERYTFTEDDQIINDNTEIVVGYPELVELIAICEADYDKRIIELIKLQIMQKVDDPSSVIIYYIKNEVDRLIFHVHGLKENEIGILSLPQDLYQQIANDLPRIQHDEPYKSILQPPYVSVRKHVENGVEE